MSEPESANTLSRRTTPTWEVELLISGGAVFAMLQLPGLLDQAFFWMEPRLEGDWRQLAILLYVYAKGASVTVACTFVLHLLLRARWIALVGMHSVYPEGVRWDKLKSKPIQREIDLAMDKPFPDLIERADNLATIVFAIGVMLALFIAGIAIFATTLSALSGLLELLSAGRVSGQAWLMLLIVALLAPVLVAVALDHWRGDQWPRENPLRRAARFMLLGYSRIGFARSSNPVMTLIASHSGERKTTAVSIGLMTIALLSGLFGILILKNSNRLGSYSMFPWPDSTVTGIDSAHYDDQRDPLIDGTAPYIQTMVANGSYVKLVLPYQPRFDEPAMRKACSDAEALDEDARGKTRVQCLAALHSISLDGHTLDTLHFDVAADPRADRPALLAMIDIRSLARGRHELRIGRAPPVSSDVPRKGSKAERDTQDFVIAFWR